VNISGQLDAADEFIDQTFKRVIYRSKVASHKTFEQCTFSHCSFSETRFEFCTFRDCVFTDCDLRLLHVKGCSFSNVTFGKSEVTYVNWTEGSWSKTGLLNSIHFSECNISYCTFIGLTLKKFSAVKCTAHDVDFSEADLAKAIFTGTDFSESRFLNTNLIETDFIGALNYAISPLVNQVKNAKFSLPQALALLAALEITIVD
jgi:fluoroquinolone resistance protein